MNPYYNNSGLRYMSCCMMLSDDPLAVVIGEMMRELTKCHNQNDIDALIKEYKKTPENFLAIKIFTDFLKSSKE